MTGRFSDHASGVDLSSDFPFYSLVPKGVEENLVFRKWLDDQGSGDLVERMAILRACRDDLLFFINAFLWIKQEQPDPADLPFITWDKQDEYVRLLCRTRRAVQSDRTGVVRGDVLAEKPRQVGWSWLTLAEGLQIIRFTKGATGLCGSRVQDDVDRRGVPKTLFWKLDYFISHCPRWFMPDAYWSASRGHPHPSPSFRSKLKLIVPGFGMMEGSATHENFGRAGQYAWMDLDEFAHTDRGQAGMGEHIWTGTTKNCRLRRVVSTPNGRGNKFASLRFSDSLPVFCVKWSDDPAKMVGSYRLSDPLVVGPTTVAAGEWWSPWMETTRKSDDCDALFAQEVLLSYEGVGGTFYDALLPVVKHDQVRPALWSGNVKIEVSAKGSRIKEFVREVPAYLEWWESPAGLLWKPGVYVMGIDVASGSRTAEGRGASNSVVSVGRLEGRRLVKLAQYATHGLMPHLFARVVCALGWCFPDSSGRPAYAIWERAGPGDSMGQTLMGELQYPHCHWTTPVRGTSVPGFDMQTFRKKDGTLTGSRVNVFNEHKKWLELGDYREPSYDTYREMEQYFYTEDAGAQHRKVKDSLDPGEGRSNHGDSVIATVLMIWAARGLRECGVERTMEADPPRMSVAWAQKRVQKTAEGAWR